MGVLIHCVAVSTLYKVKTTATDDDDDDVDESSSCDFVPHPYRVPYTEHLLLVSTGTCCTKRLIISFLPLVILGVSVGQFELNCIELMCNCNNLHF